jgi:hypothetical protein
MKITDLIHHLTQAHNAGVTEVEFYDSVTHEGLQEDWMHYGSATTPFAILFANESEYFNKNSYTLEKNLKFTKR